MTTKPHQISTWQLPRTVSSPTTQHTTASPTLIVTTSSGTPSLQHTTPISSIATDSETTQTTTAPTNANTVQVSMHVTISPPPPHTDLTTTSTTTAQTTTTSHEVTHTDNVNNTQSLTTESVDEDPTPTTELPSTTETIPISTSVAASTLAIITTTDDEQTTIPTSDNSSMSTIDSDGASTTPLTLPPIMLTGEMMISVALVTVTRNVTMLTPVTHGGSESTVQFPTPDAFITDNNTSPTNEITAEISTTTIQISTDQAATTDTVTEQDVSTEIQTTAVIDLETTETVNITNVEVATQMTSPATFTTDSFDGGSSNFNPNGTSSTVPDVVTVVSHVTNPITDDEFITPELLTSPKQFVTPDEFITPEVLTSPKEFITPEQFITPDEFVTEEEFATTQELVTPEEFITPEESTTPEIFTTREELTTQEEFITPEKFTIPGNFAPFGTTYIGTETIPFVTPSLFPFSQVPDIDDHVSTTPDENVITNFVTPSLLPTQITSPKNETDDENINDNSTTPFTFTSESTTSSTFITPQPFSFSLLHTDPITIDVIEQTTEGTREVEPSSISAAGFSSTSTPTTNHTGDNFISPPSFNVSTAHTTGTDEQTGTTRSFVTPVPFSFSFQPNTKSATTSFSSSQQSTMSPKTTLISTTKFTFVSATTRAPTTPLTNNIETDITSPFITPSHFTFISATTPSPTRFPFVTASTTEGETKGEREIPPPSITPGERTSTIHSPYVDKTTNTPLFRKHVGVILSNNYPFESKYFIGGDKKVELSVTPSQKWEFQNGHEVDEMFKTTLNNKNDPALKTAIDYDLANPTASFIDINDIELRGQTIFPDLSKRQNANPEVILSRRATPALIIFQPSEIIKDEIILNRKMHYPDSNITNNESKDVESWNATNTFAPLIIFGQENQEARNDNRLLPAPTHVLDFRPLSTIKPTTIPFLNRRNKHSFVFVTPKSEFQSAISVKDILDER